MVTFYFLQGKERNDAVSPERGGSECCPNPGHCLGPNPEPCLSVPRTHPYEKGAMYFAFFTNRISPYASYKSFLLKPYPELCLSASGTTLRRAFNVAATETLYWELHMETFS